MDRASSVALLLRAATGGRLAGHRYRYREGVIKVLKVTIMMDFSQARRQIECIDIPSEITSGFDSLLSGVKTSYASYRNALMKWHSSPCGPPPAETWKESEPYRRLVNNPEFLPLVRLQYVLAQQPRQEAVPSYVWEKVIEDMTGGPILFSEVPAVSSVETKKAICAFNTPLGELKNLDYSRIRTGLDYVCAYVKRTDKLLEQDTLGFLLQEKLI